MANSQIKWKRGDYITLGKAVSNFNKKVRKLQTEENKLVLPEEIDYKTAKEDITTRRELNRFINSLRRFSKSGAEEIIKTSGRRKYNKMGKTRIKYIKKSCNKAFKQRAC